MHFILIQYINFWAINIYLIMFKFHPKNIYFNEVKLSQALLVKSKFIIWGSHYTTPGAA